MTIWFARSHIPDAERSNNWVINDYGTRIQIKCHKPITRHHQTRSGQTCVNWMTLDSFVEPLDKLPWKNLLDKEPSHWKLSGYSNWNIYHQFIHPETIGITWNDSYCRSISDSSATGCFVASSVNSSEIADDCLGLGFRDLHYWIIQFKWFEETII